jgi:hypothetical protein
MKKGRHEIALWSGVAAFFGSLLAIGIFDVFNPAEYVQYFGALLVAFITAGSVYSKQRLDDAKKTESPTTYQKPNESEIDT